MTEMKWTPGPWRKNYGRMHSPDECDIEIVGDIFVLANINGPNYAHCEANAALIAAAPEMAEALKASQKAIREMREQGAPTAYWDDIEAANITALQKAGG